VIEPALKSSWDEDGWCVIEDALPAEDLPRARRALERMFPTAEEMAAGPGDGGPATDAWRDWDAAWPEFPFRSRSLNRLAVHDVVLDLAEDLLGCSDVRLYLALVTAKYPGQPSGFNQLLHTDFPNHTILVPRRDTGYQQLELFVYLSDATAANGATRLVSRRHTADIPVERHTLSYEEYPEAYERAVTAAAPAGSIVAYRPDVYHCSVDRMDPGTSRFLLHLAYRPAAAEWGGYQAWPFKGFSVEWHNFVAQADVRQLAALGWPRPGAPYWTAETVAGVAARYPGLDVTPWRAAIGRS
jgi:hypothetical protein